MKTQIPYYKKQPEKWYAYAKKYRIKKRRIVLTHYSNGIPKCMCCGETLLDFLTLDHPNGGGNIERKQNKIQVGYSFYLWIIKNRFPKGYSVLCYNCNIGRNNSSGICPHKQMR